MTADGAGSAAADCVVVAAAVDTGCLCHMSSWLDDAAASCSG